MQFTRSHFLAFYILLVLVDLAFGFESLGHFRIISKPALLISLLIYFILQAKANRNRTFYLLGGALFCSLLGDLFLLFEQNSSFFFTLGLGFFLIAHLLLAYGIFLFCLINDSLGLLKIPVMLYISGILAMVITAFRRKGSMTKSSFNLVFIGALFFVLSDSILALDKFLITIPYSHILIMGTYATAQYLITRGILSQGDFEY